VEKPYPVHVDIQHPFPQPYFVEKKTPLFLKKEQEEDGQSFNSFCF
jgi:hypothetical protein